MVDGYGHFQHGSAIFRADLIFESGPINGHYGDIWVYI